MGYKFTVKDLWDNVNSYKLFLQMSGPLPSHTFVGQKVPLPYPRKERGCQYGFFSSSLKKASVFMVLNSMHVHDLKALPTNK